MTAGFKISRRFFGELMLVGLGVGYLLGPSGAMTTGGQSQALKERNFRLIKTNGIRLRTVVEGSGPLASYFTASPNGWYLWRHQIDPLVEVGFQVAVPDLRGYGGRDQPEAVEAYDIIEATKDVAGLADALGQQRFIVVGQDWGAVTAWYTTLAYPQRTRAVVGMTYPFFRPDWFHRADSLPALKISEENSPTTSTFKSRELQKPNSKPIFPSLCGLCIITLPVARQERAVLECNHPRLRVENFSMDPRPKAST
jgi:pimeloyl-ACP methyl ester carboxylesterase